MEFYCAGHLDTTVKLKYDLSSRPTLTTASALESLLSQFGAVDDSSIVISLKPPKKAPTKPPKTGIALVPFKQIGDAFAAICASGKASSKLEGVDITWAAGSEPKIIGWLKLKGMLGSSFKKEPKQDEKPKPRMTIEELFRKTKTKSTDVGDASGSSAFSSFPDLIVRFFFRADVFYGPLTFYYVFLTPG